MKEVAFEILEQEIKDLDIPHSPSNLYDPISYIMSLGGKRLRPYLLMLIAKGYNIDFSKSVKAAVAIEVFHNFTLVHDDIMDHAPLRRGHETVHHKWNENVGILSGDAMMVKSYDYLIQIPDLKKIPSVIRVFNDTALKVCEGQQYDMDYESESEVSIPDYLNMIRLKTAELLAGSMKIGAIIGNASEEEQNKIYDFAINIGIAFQLMDDLLDVYADQVKFGKQVGGDIIENKKTFLYLKLESKISTEDIALWEKLKNDTNKAEKVEGVKSLYNKYGISEDTNLLINHYYEKGMVNLNDLSMTSPVIEELKTFANKLMVRES